MDKRNQLPDERQNLNLPTHRTSAGNPYCADLEKLLAPSRVLSMEEFANLLRDADIPLPTALQRENFVNHMATTYFWYEYLPRYLPGAPFYLFIDPFAGCGWQAGFFVERKERGTHYPEIATAEYRNRFGFLSCCPNCITTRFLDRNGVSWDEMAAGLGMYVQLAAMPRPILDTGRIELTLAVHPQSQIFSNWDTVRSRSQSDVYWPNESGGETTLKRIWERCAEMRQPEYMLEENRKSREEAIDSLRTKGEIDRRFLLDPILHELLEPERMRQKREMRKALDRICMLIHEARSSASELASS
ncbi:MAG TPA: hypothetical protein VGJ73_11245 [Verrucomicrobiae bacterium]